MTDMKDQSRRLNNKKIINKTQNNEDSRKSRWKVISSTKQIDADCLSRDQWRSQKFFRGRGSGSTNSVEDRRQRERGSEGR